MTNQLSKLSKLDKEYKIKVSNAKRNHRAAKNRYKNYKKNYSKEKKNVQKAIKIYKYNKNAINKWKQADFNRVYYKSKSIANLEEKEVIIRKFLSKNHKLYFDFLNLVKKALEIRNQKTQNVRLTPKLIRNLHKRCHEKGLKGLKGIEGLIKYNNSYIEFWRPIDLENLFLAAGTKLQKKNDIKKAGKNFIEIVKRVRERLGLKKNCRGMLTDWTMDELKKWRVIFNKAKDLQDRSMRDAVWLRDAAKLGFVEFDYEFWVNYKQKEDKKIESQLKDLGNTTVTLVYLLITRCFPTKGVKLLELLTTSVKRIIDRWLGENGRSIKKGKVLIDKSKFSTAENNEIKKLINEWKKSKKGSLLDEYKNQKLNTNQKKADWLLRAEELGIIGFFRKKNQYWSPLKDLERIRDGKEIIGFDKRKRGKKKKFMTKSTEIPALNIMIRVTKRVIERQLDKDGIYKPVFGSFISYKEKDPSRKRINRRPGHGVGKSIDINGPLKTDKAKNLFSDALVSGYHYKIGLPPDEPRYGIHGFFKPEYDFLDKHGEPREPLFKFLKSEDKTVNAFKRYSTTLYKYKKIEITNLNGFIKNNKKAFDDFKKKLMEEKQKKFTDSVKDLPDKKPFKIRNNAIKLIEGFIKSDDNKKDKRKKNKKGWK
ncbi:MAG: hypothetical protein JEZ06_08130 [Anaerolineaceae bacterium]|nr:hypothetical protein [Anaerolineaceae bacterium]